MIDRFEELDKSIKKINKNILIGKIIFSFILLIIEIAFLIYCYRINMVNVIVVGIPVILFQIINFFRFWIK